MLNRIFDHNRWADERVLAALRTADQPPERAMRWFAHVIAAEILWLDRIQARPQSTAVWPEPDLEAIAQTIPELHARFRDVVETDDLQRSVAYTNSAGRPFQTSLQDILCHVALHGAYHRGQVSLLMRDSGLVPEPTDYIAFVRGAPAATHPLS
ncbi:MAG: DinB family protein [Rhodothermales bacterium]|nr:DinB family protein [Rhodothermales bacterium]MBO6779224.1 DinB family protein [Rhodothermales bacterium]